jgi:arginyl-tRNA synthetase
MQDVQGQIEARLQRAVAAALGEDYAQVDPVVQPTGNPEFGDYQANLAMALGKKLGQKPRDLAQHIVDQLDGAGLIASNDIAGPGFINLTLCDDVLAEQARHMLSDARLAVPEAEDKRTVVVDYSGPNVAKEMHVGHLRSTVIGDALARLLDVRGHAVHRQNHLGDWGTQFGMLTEYLHEQGLAEQKQIKVGDLNTLYQQAKHRFDGDADFAARSRQRVVKLQSGDEQTLNLWRQLVEESKRHFNDNYARLGVQLSDDDVRGESAYNDELPKVIDSLQQAGELKTSQGAKVVFPQGFADREGEPLPMIVQKSDGGYLYATTDLAAARYRISGEGFGANWLIYVTDGRQAQHFAMVFQTLREAGWAGENVRLDHVTFGTILGPDKKPFKTREGETVKLRDLLDQAEEKAGKVIEEKNPSLDAVTRKDVAHKVGIGALKYADLASDRRKDYVFDWDRMLALEGNTAPYLQNAYVRIRSIFRKGELDPDALIKGNISIIEPTERALALKLVQLPRVMARVADTLEPHHLCTYLFELATAFHSFYEQCPVLTSGDAATRDSRLALSQLVARVLREGLGWLGIDVVERM